MRTTGASVWAAVVKMFRDQESNAHVEYGIIFALIALFVGVWGYAVTRNGHAAFSAAVVPAGASVTPDGRGSDHPFAERLTTSEIFPISGP